MYYFTSDLHFGSHKTLERENRPFNSNEEFYNFIIHDFCKCNSEDIIYIVGDYVNHSDKNKIDMNTISRPYRRKQTLSILAKEFCL